MGRVVATVFLLFGLIAIAGSTIYVLRDRMFGPSKEQRADAYIAEARNEHPIVDIRETFPREGDDLLAKMREIEITDDAPDDVVRREHELLAAIIDTKPRLAAQSSTASIRRIMEDRLAHAEELRRMDVASCARAAAGREEESPRSASSSDAAWNEFHDMLVAAAEGSRAPQGYARPTMIEETLLRTQLSAILPSDEYEAYVSNATPDGIDPTRQCDIGIGVLKALLQLPDENFGPYASSMLN